MFQTFDIKNTRRMILLALLLAVLSLQPAGVAAYKSSNSSPAGAATSSIVLVTILTAQYCDIDSDLVDDDILTTFRVTVNRYTCIFDQSYVYCILRLPSGATYLLILKVIGQYSTMTIKLGWLNLAYIRGWYHFTVNAEILDRLRGTSLWGYSEVLFDPPTEGSPGPPLVKILSTSFG